MAKLYIFGIGGTGSRVLKAFSMLMASGVKLNGNIETVIPIIIDPDISNGDKVRTSDILSLYHEIRKDIHNPEDFFSVDIKTLQQVYQQGNPFSQTDFIFNIDGADTQKFREFIGEGQLSDPNNALKELLFSDNNLEADMSVGFKGNPNIGSVVINQIVKSNQYIEFAQTYTPGDKIFIISSIFGGTGAAGFPLLIKNLRSANPQIPNANDIQNASIGALTVLPYFNVTTNNQSEIDSDSFLEKAKSAMSYYDRSLIQNNVLNGLYYIGDMPKATYSNVEGSQNQRNDAHFIELAGALSIIDFCKNAGSMSTMNGIAVNTYFKEFGVNQNSSHMNFGSLGQESREIIKGPLSKMTLSSIFLRLGRENSQRSLWMTDNSSKTDSGFFSSPDYKNKVKKFLDFYDEWLKEMAQNVISFKPFNIQVDKDNAMRFIEGIEPSKDGLLKSNNGFKRLDMAMSDCFGGHNTNTPINQLIKTLEKATENVLSNRKLI